MYTKSLPNNTVSYLRLLITKASKDRGGGIGKCSIQKLSNQIKITTKLPKSHYSEPPET